MPEPATLIVTGGAHGIGSEIVAEAQARGLRPIVLDLEPTEGGWVADLADPAQAAATVEDIWNKVGPIAGLVNNAGVIFRGSLLATTPDAFASVLAVNLVGAYACMHTLAALWKSQGLPGNVVNVTSAHAVLAQAERSAYAASKAGLESLTRSAALELGPEIGVFGLAAGYTQTEPGRTRLVGERAQLAGKRVPLGRVVTANEVASAAVDLVTGRYPAMTGQILRLDGGWSSTDVALESLKA